VAKRSRPTARPSSPSGRSAPSAKGRGGLSGAFAGLGVLLVWALILGVPLIVTPTAVESFRLPKRMLAEWLGLASLLALSLSAALAPSSVGAAGERDGGRATPFWRRSAFLAVAPLTLVASVGLLTSGHAEHVRAALPDLWIGAACLVGWSWALSSERLERLLAGLGIPGALLAGLAILQFHDLYRPFAFSRGEETARLGVTSLAGNAGDLGAFLVLPVLVAQWRLAGGGGRRGQRGARGRLAVLLWAFVLVVCLYGVAVTQTLTVLAAVLAGSALFWLVRLPRRKAFAAVGGAIALAAVLALTVAPLRSRIAGEVGALREGRINQALTGRLDGWRTAWWMLEEHPVVGVGHGAYRSEFARAKLALIERGVPFYRGHVDPFFANAHNEILEAGAEWGLLGWLALGWGLWFLGRAAVRGFRAGSEEDETSGDGAAIRGRRADRALALGGLASVAVLSLGQFPFRIALAAYPALLLMAWVFRRADDREIDTATAAETAGARGGRFGRWLAWGAALVLVWALIDQTGRWRDLVAASKRLRVVEAVTAQAMASGGKVPDRVIGGSVRLLRQAERLDPSDVAVQAGLAGQYLLAGSPLRAEDALRRALKLEARPELYLNLGRALLAQGDREAAREAFTDAVRLAPRLLRQVPASLRPAIRRATLPPRAES